MTLKEIREMLQLMKDHGLTELEVEREGMKIRLRKGISGAPQIMVDQGPMAVPVAAAEPSRESAAPTPSKRTTINSPMVGTFYAAPAPDAPAFTEVGGQVGEGQVVCIIEAMKLMNEIKADASGRVVEIHAVNGDPVEFGQPLFSIEPA